MSHVLSTSEQDMQHYEKEISNLLARIEKTSEESRKLISSPEEQKIFDFEKNKQAIFALCLMSLTSITVVFNILAILKNIQWPRHKE